ncbi:hypothetical protein [Halomarina ordinaria]|uniref:Yip1 domain-containing protein n=1 Tax=Halomarina ordinaria TaxID=3033939 RepID=A0ABD5UBW8_9EURY|nr:hypothetical protein [Halomarina sp. PSRA2]
MTVGDDLLGVHGLEGPVPLPQLPLQAVDLPSALATPGPTRAVAAFLSTLVFGGAVLYRYGGRLDEAVDATAANPLVSALYGLAAYGLAVFLVGYAYSQLARLGVVSPAVATLVGSVLAVLLLSLAGLGFVVAGTWLTTAVGGRDPWLGLVGVGAVGALVWLVFPFGLALVVWFGIAGVGVGGPTRRWIHRDATESGEG